MNFLYNKKGFASFETVLMAASLVIFMYVAAQFMNLIISSERTMIETQADVWDHLDGIKTPCLESVADGNYAEGRHKLVSDTVSIGLGDEVKNYQITKEVTFMKDAICSN